MNSTLRNMFILIILPLQFALGCFKREQPDVKDNTVIVNKVGTHRYMDRNVEISEVAGLIHLAIKNSGGRLEFELGMGHTSSRWYVAFDESIWSYSGDIGVFRVQKDSAGRFNKTLIDGNNGGLIREMPEQFYENLPQSLKKRWSKFRGP